MNNGKIILSVKNLSCEYRTAKGETLKAVSDIGFDVYEGETLGLVGESGCGKSTTGKCIIQLEPATTGSILFNGIDLTTLKKDELRKVRRQLQLVFQDPVSSLNPRRTCGDIVAEPLRIAKEFDETIIKEKVRTALETVGFNPDDVWLRKPHEFSGGQCQRISLARAIVSEPKFLVCDEPVSALDVSVQAQILNLLEDMKARYGLTLIFISHDLAVIKQICDRIAVMYLGSLCEIAPVDELFSNPKHPYTQALLQCVPSVERPLDYTNDTAILAGEIPSPLNPPSGCRFRTRCSRAEKTCAELVPHLEQVLGQHYVACPVVN